MPVTTLCQTLIFTGSANFAQDKFQNIDPMYPTSKLVGNYETVGREQ